MAFRNGDIFLTCSDIGMWSNLPVLIIGKSGKSGIKCITGRHEIVLERDKLYPHGRVRPIKEYSYGKNRFRQFRVNFGDDDYIIDIRVSDPDSPYKIEDLRKIAFLRALEKRQ